MLNLRWTNHNTKTETFNENKFHEIFPITIGLKLICHYAIETRFIDEIKDLSSAINNSFYTARRKKCVHMKFEIIDSLADQLKRREMNYLMGDNSIFGARYLFAANIDSMVDYLPPC